MRQSSTKGVLGRDAGAPRISYGRGRNLLNHHQDTIIREPGNLYGLGHKEAATEYMDRLGSLRQFTLDVAFLVGYQQAPRTKEGNRIG